MWRATNSMCKGLVSGLLLVVRPLLGNDRKAQRTDLWE